MKNDVFMAGVLAIVLASGVTMMIWDWTIGPEFWPFVPAFAALGAALMWTARRIV